MKRYAPQYRMNMQTRPNVRCQASGGKQTQVWRFVIESQVRLAFQKDKTAAGAWIKQEIGNLGPAFVKFGQFVSTRQDLFGKEVAEQLTQLQDNVNPVPYELIETSIRRELGAVDISTVFSEIDPVYIGTASIGQVHRARLRANGREVVIKVQKPNIEMDVRDNLQTLKEQVLSSNKLFNHMKPSWRRS
jgi:predicted unusual protein kinase regulating ubiquinone biosynthesis (AarF/ABC1/UbiB family)